jgi:hypothetical protein
LVWKANPLKALEGEGSDFGYSITPLLWKGLVILSIGGKDQALVALDAEDGSLRWRCGNGTGSYSSPLPLVAQGKEQIVCILQNAVLGVDPLQGRVLWELSLSEGYDEYSAWPLVGDGYLIFASAFCRGGRRLDLGAKEPLLRWENREFGNDIMSSVLLKDTVYGFALADIQSATHGTTRGSFQCLDAVSGEVLWSTPEVKQASVIAADGKLLALDDGGALSMLKATRQGYVPLAKFQALKRGPCWTQPTLSEGRLFLRNHEELVCLYLREPETLSAEERAGRDSCVLGEDSEAATGSPSWHSPSLLTPDRNDMWRWFWYTLALIPLSGALAAVVGLVVGAALRRPIFLGLNLLLGGMGLFAAGHAFGGTFFTWPLALFALFTGLLSAGESCRRREDVAGRLGARFLLLLFLGGCGGYGLLCLHLGIAIGSGFLVGLLPALPMALIQLRRRPGPLRLGGMVLFLVNFCLFYWASALFILWRSWL